MEASRIRRVGILIPRAVRDYKLEIGADSAGQDWEMTVTVDCYNLLLCLQHVYRCDRHLDFMPCLLPAEEEGQSKASITYAIMSVRCYKIIARD